jgi:hypothetical protein
MTNRKIERLYLLKDGTYADPKDCSTVNGELRHANGVPVALNGEGEPETLGETTASNALAAAGADRA